jgi:hypothetical protein
MLLEKHGTPAISNMLPIAQNITSEFKRLTTGDYQTAVLYAALAGAVVSDVLPTPAMALAYFKMKLLQKKNDSTPLSGAELRAEIGKAYSYALPAWWISVFTIIHFHKGSFEDKAKLAFMIVGSGAVIGALFQQRTKHLFKI